MTCGGFFIWKNVVFLWHLEHYWYVVYQWRNVQICDFWEWGAERARRSALWPHWAQATAVVWALKMRCGPVPCWCPDPPNNTTAAWAASPAPTTSSVFSLCCVSEQWAQRTVGDRVKCDPCVMVNKISSDYNYVEKMQGVAKLEFLKCHKNTKICQRVYAFRYQFFNF